MLSHDIVIVGDGKQAPLLAVNALTLLNDKSSTAAWDAMHKGHEWLAAPEPLQDAAR